MGRVNYILAIAWNIGQDPEISGKQARFRRKEFCKLDLTHSQNEGNACLTPPHSIIFLFMEINGSKQKKPFLKGVLFVVCLFGQLVNNHFHNNFNELMLFLQTSNFCMSEKIKDISVVSVSPQHNLHKCCLFVFIFLVLGGGLF